MRRCFAGAMAAPAGREAGTPPGCSTGAAAVPRGPVCCCCDDDELPWVGVVCGAGLAACGGAAGAFAGVGAGGSPAVPAGDDAAVVAGCGAEGKGVAAAAVSGAASSRVRLTARNCRSQE